jgi:hypothetical protein
VFHILAVSVADVKASAEATVTVVASGFTPTGSMETPRSGHTATLLPDGKVLIAGGFDGSSALQTAELFDPATNAFSATGNMTSPRINHTATLLANGKVLLSGGGIDQGAGGALATAELYDPATGTFVATGPMAVARTAHTATVLADGRVLIVGGANSGGVLSSAEIYDVATSAFTSTGSLHFARGAHAAALLADGKVLVAGGDGADNLALGEAELYDANAGIFTAAGSMSLGRELLTLSALPDGNVLAAGGTETQGECLEDGCFGNFGPVSNADLYDPPSGTFTAASNMLQAHGGHTATVLASGKVLIVGGETFAVELFNPTSGTFSLAGSLEVARARHTATLLNDGRVLVTGGEDLSGNALGTVEIYK